MMYPEFKISGSFFGGSSKVSNWAALRPVVALPVMNRGTVAGRWLKPIPMLFGTPGVERLVGNPVVAPCQGFRLSILRFFATGAESSVIEACNWLRTAAVVWVGSDVSAVSRMPRVRKEGA